MLNVNPGRTIATFMVAFQSLMALAGALVLFAGAHRAGRWGFGDAIAHRRAEAGMVLLVVAVAVCVIAVFLALDAGWAQIAAIVFEALVVAGSVVRIGIRPGAALIAIAFAGGVIVLLAREHRSDGDADATNMPNPPDPATT
jgi:hypothetical protein